MRKLMLVLSFNLSLVTIGAYCQSSGDSDALERTLDQMQSDDKKLSDEALKSLIEKRKRIINRLCELITEEKVTFCYSSSAKASKYNAIVAIGVFKAEEAVDLLLDNLLYGVGVITESMQPEPPSPALQGLIAIGKPAIKVIFERLEKKSIDDLIVITLPDSMKDKAREIQYSKGLVRVYLRRLIQEIVGESSAAFLRKAIDEARNAQKETLTENLRKLAIYWRDELPEEYWKEK